MAASDDPPKLDRPMQVVRALLVRSAQQDHADEPVEVAYLDSRKPAHRWGRGGFPDAFDEFQFKAIWVAKQLREALGRPEHDAYLAVLERQLVGLRAAAWLVGGKAAYLSLRSTSGPRYARRDGRHRFTVVLGVVPPRPRERGPEGDEARAAVFVPQLIH